MNKYTYEWNHKISCLSCGCNFTSEASDEGLANKLAEEHLEDHIHHIVEISKVREVRHGGE